jgi:hypothetical protein
MSSIHEDATQGAQSMSTRTTRTNRKMILELLFCIVHPLAVGLIWINLVNRDDLGTNAKLAWGGLALIPVVPFVYVLAGNDLWPSSPKAVTT